MKIRSAFVANSSSSSFIIVGHQVKLTDEQIENGDGSDISYDAAEEINKRNNCLDHRKDAANRMTAVYDYENDDDFYTIGVDIMPLIDGAAPEVAAQIITESKRICKENGIDDPRVYLLMDIQ